MKKTVKAVKSVTKKTDATNKGTKVKVGDMTIASLHVVCDVLGVPKAKVKKDIIANLKKFVCA